MANRLFLTLLALLTGLVAQIGPAQARVSDAREAGVRAELCVHVLQRRCSPATLVKAPASVLGTGDIALSSRPLPLVTWRAVTVRPGVERSRE